MPVPTYQQLMLPILERVSDGQIHTTRSMIDPLADKFNLSPAERQETLGYGQRLIVNRISWAVIYLHRAGLLEKPFRGQYRITPRGVAHLQTGPAEITLEYLKSFPEFVAFLKGSSTEHNISESATTQPATTASNSQTPDERIESAAGALHADLAAELKSRVDQLSPAQFESLVLKVLHAMGYGGSIDSLQRTGRAGDRGIDGIIKEDRLGLDSVYVQAKHYTQDVGPAAIREFVGSLGEHRARKGVFVTSSGFTAGSYEAAQRATSPIALIDGNRLIDLMIEHNLGVSLARSIEIKKIDSDFFEDFPI
jgi:restriction system protein